MQITKLNDRLSVSPQIAVDDVPAIAAEGFKTVICNRPDNETPDQPPMEDIRSAVEAAGMTFHLIPIAGGAFPPEQLQAFGDSYANDDGPILAFCRSGMRSACLWAIAESPNSGPEAVLDAADRVGYNLAAIRPLLKG